MSITIRFLRERGDLRWRAIECVLVNSLVKLAQEKSVVGELNWSQHDGSC